MTKDKQPVPRPHADTGDPAPQGSSRAGDAEAGAKRPRIPPPDPKAREEGKVFATAKGPDVPLVVTVSDGSVTKRYAPAELISKVAHAVNSVVKDMAGTGYDAMLFAAQPGNSMRLYFGDPEMLASGSHQIHISFVFEQSIRVASLIELEDDEFFERAVQIGSPAAKYGELAKLVHTERITLKWQPRGERPRVLTPGRAGRQYTRLARPGEPVSHPLTVNGTLYRVIAEPSSRGGLGTVGLRLHSWSALPPKAKKGGRVTGVVYEEPEVEAKIKAGLLGESVQAKLWIRTFQIGTTVDPEGFELVLGDIAAGPGEDARVGDPMFDDDGDVTSAPIDGLDDALTDGSGEGPTDAPGDASADESGSEEDTDDGRHLAGHTAGGGEEEEEEEEEEE
jgi:hypothetical protein